MSKYYFYIDNNGEQQGPLVMSQLSPSLILPDTMVWCEGMAQWQKASSLPNFYQFWGSTDQNNYTPPPIRPVMPDISCQYNNNRGYEPMPKTWIIESVLLMVLCCLVGGLVPLLYGSKVETMWSMGNKEEAYRYSKLAGAWVKWVFVISIILIVLYLFIFILLPIMGLGFMRSWLFNFPLHGYNIV